MRTFLVCLLGEKEWIVGEVLAFDKGTKMMRIKLKDGMVRMRHFDPKLRYNRSDFRFATTEIDNA